VTAVPGKFSSARKRISGCAGEDLFGTQRVTRICETGHDVVVSYSRVPDQDKVIQGTGIGGDEPHRRLESKTLKVIPIAIQVVDRIRDVDLMSLEEGVQRLTRRQSEQMAQFRLRETTETPRPLAPLGSGAVNRRQSRAGSQDHRGCEWSRPFLHLTGRRANSQKAQQFRQERRTSA
jgi:hypothetical protein